MFNKTHIAIITPIVLLLLIVGGCSTQKNTANSRWWHSFNAKYNTYYNGSLAYIDGSLEKETGNKDNFTERIPLYTVGNKKSRELGKGNFDRAIEKCEKAIKLHSIKRRPEWNKSRRKTARDIDWLSRKEYNPFLWKAWMLMGRSQFYKGAFDEAASTFSYMSRLYKSQPAIYGKARAWLAKCYIEQEWMYDAEDVIRNMQRDSMDWRATKEWDYTYADYYIHTNEYQKAIPYLKKVIKHEMRRKQKAREWYLLGQLQAALGQNELAYKAFKHVIRQNPPYELEFNSRISMTEVMAKGHAKQMISRLKQMAYSDKNKDYLDQVYYAIGNIYLNQKDTLKAIDAYEKGNRKSTRSGIEKGVLLLKLGDLYWAKEKFSDAQRCYGEAIGLLDKERKDYKQLSERSKVLDELVPYTDAVHLQDSLQVLAKMPEAERNAAIDRVITALKKKEKEERDKQADANAQQQQQKNGGYGNQNMNQNQTQNQNQNKNGLWYFYNQMVVNQGKQTFQKIWGKRENIDDWQRVNKTVVGGLNASTDSLAAKQDSIDNAELASDSLKNGKDSAQNDPHKREYYLAQIPFSEDQVKASNLIIEDGLYNSGVIFKDKLDNLRLSEKNLRRLIDDYKDYEHMDNAYYHLFLLYSRLNEPAVADSYVELLKRDYPKSQWTTILTDPYFKENAKFGVHIEDSLYAATYDAFKADRYGEVSGKSHISETRFPLGENRDKFIFINGLSKLNNGDVTGCVDDMNKVVKDYPKSGVSEMAGMIVNGVKAGKKLHGAKFDIGNVWERRSDVLNDSDSINAKKFSPERDAKFVFMIVYQPDSVNQNQLLFELAKYNFTNFLARHFDIETEDEDVLRRMKINGFMSFDEALQYVRQLYSSTKIASLTTKCKLVIISEPNLQLLGTQFSYKDYDDFYAKNFAPLKISNQNLLTEPTEIEVQKPAKEDTEQPQQNGKAADDGMYIVPEKTKTPAETGITIAPEEEKKKPENNNDTVIPVEEKKQPAKPTDNGTTVVEPQNNTTVIPDNGITVAPEEKTQGNDVNGTTIVMPEEKPAKGNNTDDTIIIPEEKEVKKPAAEKPKPTVTAKPTTQTKPQPTQKAVEKKQTDTTVKKTQPATKPQKPVQQQVTPKKEDTGIYFDDGFGLDENNTPKKDDKKKTDDKKKRVSIWKMNITI